MYWSDWAGIVLVTALVAPVVRAGVQHDEVRCRRVIKELTDVVKRVGIRVVSVVRVRIVDLRIQVGKVSDRLIRQDRVARHGRHVEVGPVRAPSVSSEPQVTVGRRHLVRVRFDHPGDEVDDGGEVTAQQRRECLVTGGRTRAG